MTEDERVKIQMRREVWKIKPIRRACKYLTFNSGIAMLRANNIQFTSAEKLNDTFDCNSISIDFSNIRSLNTNSAEHNQTISNIERDWEIIRKWGICSLGYADNDYLWERYASTDNIENGICIELNLQVVIDKLATDEHKFVALPVHYVDSVCKLIPAENFYMGDKVDKNNFFIDLLSSKNRIDPLTTMNWERENEIRLVSPVEQEDYVRWNISPECIYKVYYGKYVDDYHKNILMNVMTSQYPNIKAIRHS